MGDVPSVWLASNSARRSAILASRWVNRVDVLSRGIDGTEPSSSSDDNLLDAVQQTCAWKIRTAISQSPSTFTVVLASDTLVESPSGGQILGQPSSIESAKRMLIELIGKPHRVATCTAWAIPGTSRGVIHENTQIATIKLLDPGDTWLDAYLTTGGWCGKAGGYDVGGDFSPWFTIIQGSILTILGFAVSGLESLEEAFGIEPNLGKLLSDSLH